MTRNPRPLLALVVIAALVACGRAQEAGPPAEPETMPPTQDEPATDPHADADADADTGSTARERAHTEAAEPRHAHTNRLAKESSPYLLQHRHNPVDWFPWGDEAFEHAKETGKPIFLSIGYSTCHWCHVMERESFESEEIAKVMNEHFVCIKVDREERPDVDAIYMKAVTAMTGRGGWPLSAWLTPERKPFMGGTYFPPDDRYGRPGFKTVLLRVAELWKTRRAELENQAEELLTHVRSQNQAVAGDALSEEVLDLAVRQYESAYDKTEGGFGPAPKFPRAFSLSFLVRRVDAKSRDRILPWVTGTLDAMQDGGLHDHLGGGFHRYSTDREWLVPHFEKMLYDQATLARAYVEANQVTGDAQYATTARGVFDYVLRDLRDEAGGFHSAEDADSEGEEGKFYVCTYTEIAAVLGAEDGALFRTIYKVEPGGNWIDEATRSKPGTNILHLEFRIEQHAREQGRELGDDETAFAARITALRDKLLAVRSERIRPHLDDKVLTDWNGLMIGAMAYGGQALGEPAYVDAAREAADFFLREMKTSSGLLHRYRDGQAGIDGFLDDYANLANGLLDLHQATQEARWLEAAHTICQEMVARFRDAEGGGFLLATGRDDLVADTKELYDGARPSGNSAAALALLRVGRLTGDDDLESMGRQTLADWSGTIGRYPMGHPYALRALDFDLGPTREIVIAGDPADERTQALLATARDRFVARDLILLHPPGDAGADTRRVSPFVGLQTPVDGVPAAYVCTNRSCKAPVTTPDALRALLD